MLPLIVLLPLSLLLAASFWAYRIAFAKGASADMYTLPDGAQYRTYHAQIKEHIQNLKAAPFEQVTTLSHDGLVLSGRYYHFRETAPLVILFHGYRSWAEVDGCGGWRICREHGYNILLVDQRAHGKSQGKTITMGVLERQDCLAWANFAVERFGSGVKILLFGLSMGAATVLMASDLPLPPQVKGIAADCGYSSPEAILRQEAKKRGLPVGPAYWLMRLGARLYGQFDPSASSPLQSLQACSLPVLFLHGEEDHFVPVSMSQENYFFCASDKQLLLFPGAGHGISYFKDMETYVTAVCAFLEKVTS